MMTKTSGQILLAISWSQFSWPITKGAHHLIYFSTNHTHLTLSAISLTNFHFLHTHPPSLQLNIINKKHINRLWVLINNGNSLSYTFSSNIHGSHSWWLNQGEKNNHESELHIRAQLIWGAKSTEWCDLTWGWCLHRAVICKDCKLNQSPIKRKKWGWWCLVFYMQRSL